MGLVVPNSQHLKPVCKGRQRYARTDTSVTAQALRIVGAAGAVMTGGSGTPGLPFILATAIAQPTCYAVWKCKWNSCPTW